MSVIYMECHNFYTIFFVDRTFSNFIGYDLRSGLVNFSAFETNTVNFRKHFLNAPGNVLDALRPPILPIKLGAYLQKLMLIGTTYNCIGSRPWAFIHSDARVRKFLTAGEASACVISHMST